MLAAKPQGLPPSLPASPREEPKPKPAAAPKGHKKGSVLSGVDINEESDLILAEQLKLALSKSAGARTHAARTDATPCSARGPDFSRPGAAGRVIDLFREWDADGDGQVSKKEFRKAMPLLGVDFPKDVIDGLFDEFDVDGGGSIGYAELKKMLAGASSAGGKTAGRGRGGGRGGR